VPTALTIKVALLPWVTATSSGCAVMNGAMVSASQALELITLPAMFATRTE